MRDRGKWIVGVDIGGTSLAVGVIPVRGGDVKAYRTLATEAHRGAGFVVERVVHMIEEAIRVVLEEEGGTREDFVGVGLGSPGPLDRQTGTVITTPNLGWRNFPLRDLVRNEIHMPVTLDNDANCAALGEWWMGAGRGLDSLVAITIGTGIGGGIVIGGEVLHGASDVAGEIGHTTINYGGRKCKCGNYGCLEAYASGPNIAARAMEGLEAGTKSVLGDVGGGALTAADVCDAAGKGDRYAAEIIVETAKYLGAGIANVINILNPQAVIVFGGVARAGDLLFEPLRQEVRVRSFRPAADACRILPAELPDTAGIVGAAGIFRQVLLGRD